jgi:hypothetical protein
MDARRRAEPVYGPMAPAGGGDAARRPEIRDRDKFAEISNKTALPLTKGEATSGCLIRET